MLLLQMSQNKIIYCNFFFYINFILPPASVVFSHFLHRHRCIYEFVRFFYSALFVKSAYIYPQQKWNVLSMSPMFACAWMLVSDFCWTSITKLKRKKEKKRHLISLTIFSFSFVWWYCYMLINDTTKKEVVFTYSSLYYPLFASRLYAPPPFKTF